MAVVLKNSDKLKERISRDNDNYIDKENLSLKVISHLRITIANEMQSDNCNMNIVSGCAKTIARIKLEIFSLNVMKK